MGKLDIIKAAVTANPVDLVTAIVDAVGANSNDAKAKAAFAELVEEMFFELQREWSDRDSRDRPKAEDVSKGLAKLAEAYHRANSNKKRRILWNAFWNSFKPEFYDEAITNILWEKVETLEYPDFRFLDRLLKETDPKNRSTQRMEGWERGGRGIWRGDQIPVRQSEEEAEYAERLSRENLASIERSDSGAVLYVSWVGLAPKLRDFALKEFEFYEAEKTSP